MPPGPDAEREKRAAAEAAAALVEDGMAVGLGTGSTVEHLLPALAARGLGIRCVATSPATERAARQLGLQVESFDRLDRLDIAIDGADQVAPDGWVVKGGGGAHLREKIVAAAAERFVVIVDSGKSVEEISPPVPLELMSFGLRAILRALGAGTASAVNLLDVDAVIIGGGLGVRFGEPYVKRIEKRMMKNLFTDNNPPVIRVAALGDFGGAIGASLLLSGDRTPA